MRLKCSQLVKNVKAFIFDLDGTLIDSVDSHVRSWSLAFRIAAGINVGYRSLYPLIGLSGADIMRRVLGSRAEPDLMSRIRWIKDRAFLKEVLEGRVNTYPGVNKLLKYLKRYGFKIGVASSTPNRLLIHILEYLRLINYFDVITGGDEVRRGKPDPEIFKLTMSKLGVSPAEAVVVGDTEYDMYPAIRLGATPVLVNKYCDGLAGESLTGIKVYREFHELTAEVLSCLK